VYLDSCDIRFGGCTFERNQFSGIEAYNSKVTLTECEVKSNLGGGIGVHRNSLVLSTGAKLSRNRAFGILVDTGATFAAEGGQITGSHAPGVIVNGAKATLSKLTISGSPQAGVQVDGAAGGLVTLIGVTVQANGTGVIAGEGGRARISTSKFVGNGLHCDAQDQSAFFIEESEFSGSKDGVGIVAHSGAVLHLENCKVSHEKSYGIVSETDLTIVGASVLACGIAGIAFLDGAKGKITDSTIESNPRDGVHIIGGTPDLKGCKIRKNGGYGIVKAKQCVDADIHGNTIEANKSGHSITGEFQFN
jgi:hypothetical protein